MIPTKESPVTTSLYDEAVPMLYASEISYRFSHLLRKFRNDRNEHETDGEQVELNTPDNFPVDLEKYVDENCVFKDVNDGNGLSYAQLYELFTANEDLIAETVDNKEFVFEIIDDVKENLSTGENPGENVFLSSFRSLKGKVKCVYGVIKDRRHKRIILVFRGSENPGTNRDWNVNFDALLVTMKTPKMVRDKMPEGPLRERVLVHEGFYDYLFDNKVAPGQQRYDDIISDIRPLFEMEEGYSLYVTGHSLGGALATMFACKIAGSGLDWLARPVTLISWAAPFSGTAGFRAVFEQLEIDGLIRSLRVTNAEDVVPTVPPCSNPFANPITGYRRAMKHTGINLRLTKNGMSFTHSSKESMSKVIHNTMLKPVWRELTWHTLSFYDQRVEKYKEALSATSLDEFYRDTDVVADRFLKGMIDATETNVPVDEDSMDVVDN